mgnify:CR=1 FL=1
MTRQTIYDYEDARKSMGIPTNNGVDDYMALKEDITELYNEIMSMSTRSIQTGYISTSTLLSGAGEDLVYIDIPITEVSNIEKYFTIFEGGGGVGATAAIFKSGSTNSYLVTTRLTSTTNLRISSSVSATFIVGRWKVMPI